MLPFTGRPSRLCTGPSRREFLRLGALTPAALALPTLLTADAAPRRRLTARSCLLIFMEGGPSHIDLWDMKPDAPAEVRGEFRPIQTKIPGITVCEHLPLAAKLWHHLAQVRSVHHAVNDHNAGAYYMLTGRSPVEGSKLIVANSPKNFPPYGAVLAKLRPPTAAVPGFVHIPEYQWNNGVDLAGQGAGFLGAAFDPFVSGDPSLPDYRVPGLDLLPELPLDRLGTRNDLRADLDRTLARLGDSESIDRMTVFQKKALEIITSPAARKAFDLSQEPAAVRERYGLDPGSDRSTEARKFGGLPHLGQCLLLSRRLIEAGVRLVTLMTGRKIDQAWDTHRDHFPLLKKSLLPPFDRAFSALLTDFVERDLLKDTLLVVMGEFGRTPKLGYVTSSAGAAKNGRDHWPSCYTIFLAGGGIPPGAIHGSSDRTAAVPKEYPVTPEDIAATIYAALGIDPTTEIHDPLGKPYELAPGRPIERLLG
jgi:hypothetical protein